MPSMAQDGVSVANIGTAEQVEKTRVELFGSAAGTGRNAQGLGAIPIFEGLQLGGDLVQSLIPGDLLPLVFTFFTGPFKGVIEAVRMVKRSRSGAHLRGHFLMGEVLTLTI